VTDRGDPIRFDGQVAVVTGAGRGLGRAYARLLAGRGASVVVHDAGVDLNGNGGDRSVADGAVEEIVAAGGRAVPSYEDLAADGAAARIVGETMERFGRVDVLVSNAGLLGLAPIEEIDDALFGRMVAVNVEAPFLLCRAVFPSMKANGYGRIVLTTSGRALYVDAGMSGLAAYSVGKGAQLGLMISLAAEGLPHGIHVNAVSPVATTRMTLSRPAENEMTPEHVAPGVAYLASSACNVSGVVLRAAGGRFSVASYAPSDGVDLGPGPIEPEAVAERWDEISRRASA
jgi:NAD(P)-dependent dehydrogenase (short-subunit alcohol dehydrogenase family)